MGRAGAAARSGPLRQWLGDGGVSFFCTIIPLNNQSQSLQQFIKSRRLAATPLLPKLMKLQLTAIGIIKNVCWGLAFVPLLVGCDSLFGKVVARLPINVVSTAGHEVMKQATLPLKKNDKIALWSDMELAYEGNSPVRFQVLITRDGSPFKQLQIDPTEKNVTIGEVKTDINGSVDWRFSGKNAELAISEAGSYTFKAMLVAADNLTLRVTKAGLVLKK
jgi:hypothetical protein